MTHSKDDSLKIFQVLGVEPCALMLDSIQLEDLGRIVRVECTYIRPDGAKMPFATVFHKCREMMFTTYENMFEIDDPRNGGNATLLDFFIGSENYESQMFFHAFDPTIECKLLYESVTITKSW